ncbi:MAG: DUF359 domain-containing protein [Candidatus Thermoplasmatota archaeon]|nr:DUF359 domain-containing protein [Candidatus Thermoplasmatota archaeon]
MKSINPKVIYRMPDQLRASLAEPIGPIIEARDAAPYLRGAKAIISVGDVVTANLYKYGFVPDVAIVDYKTKRNITVDFKNWRDGRRIVKVANPQSTITQEMQNAISEAYAHLPQKTLIEVDGEEDLAALACINLAPGTYIIVYGMPDKGMTVVTPGENEKKRVAEILAEMKAEA